MEIYYYTLFTVFIIIALMIVIDPNVGSFIDLLIKIIKVKVERFIWMVIYHPNNFITTWLQNRKYDKIARELEKEFELKNNGN
jgi:chromosomal replication initiation ATPase DnaA